MKTKQASPPATTVGPEKTGPKDEPTKRHRFSFRLHNGFVGELQLPAKVIDRLWYKVQHPGDTHHFIVFDGEQRRFALNIRHVLASQFDPAKQGGLEGQPVRETGEFSVFTLRTHRHLFG
jgi:hypothetical protein